jgi:hypothetical protein
MTMNRTLIIGAVAALVGAAAVYFTNTGGGETTSGTGVVPAQGAAMVEVALPQTLSQTAQLGQTAFDSACAGRIGNGPPLIHKVYEPSHHSDMAFHLAVQNGVRAHHWKFGNMPAQEGLTRGDVDAIVAYIREVQQANGIN